MDTIHCLIYCHCPASLQPCRRPFKSKGRILRLLALLQPNPGKLHSLFPLTCCPRSPRSIEAGGGKPRMASHTGSFLLRSAGSFRSKCPEQEAWRGPYSPFGIIRASCSPTLMMSTTENPLQFFPEKLRIWQGGGKSEC